MKKSKVWLKRKPFAAERAHHERFAAQFVEIEGYAAHSGTAQVFTLIGAVASGDDFLF